MARSRRRAGRATRAAAELDRLVAGLHDGGRLRVWSIVITIFGDAILPRGGVVGLATLQAITDRLAIEPGALRTAMSRLTQDGWVNRRRRGRNSFYDLTEKGIVEFDVASRRIYAPGPKPAGRAWTLLLGQGLAGGERSTLDQRLGCLGFLVLQHGAYLWTDIRPAPLDAVRGEGFLVIEGKVRAVPAWLQAAIGPAALAEGYRVLMADFADLAACLAAGGSLSPLDAMAARCLLVHGWRRLLLRQVDAPSVLFSETWPGEPARAFVGDLYARLLPASEAWLQDAGVCPTGPLPSADPPVETRFRSPAENMLRYSS